MSIQFAAAQLCSADFIIQSDIYQEELCNQE